MKRLIILLPLLNFKNIQIKWRLTISLYSLLHYSSSLYSPLSQNFQTQHKSDHTPLSFEPNLRYCCLLPGFLIGVMQLMSAEITHGCWFPHHQNMNGIGCKWVYRLMALPISTKLSKQDLQQRDFYQRYGIDYSKMFSLMIKPTFVGIVVSIALKWFDI